MAPNLPNFYKISLVIATLGKSKILELTSIEDSTSYTHTDTEQTDGRR